jgi:putative peptidoglycan lipid II flippase
MTETHAELAFRLRFSTRLWRMLRADRVLIAIGVVAGITLGVRAVSVVRELLVARAFGVSNALDAFVIAYLVPSFAITVVAGSMTAALIPTYVAVREQRGGEAAERLLSGALFIALVLITLVTAVLAATVPLFLHLLASGFSPEKLDMTEHLTYLLLPLIALSGLSAVLVGVLNAGERFAIAALTPAVTSLVVSLFVVLLAAKWGIYVVGVGFVAGGCLELVVLGMAVRHRKVSIRPRWIGWNEDLRTVAQQYAPLVVGAVLMSSTLLIDQAMASTLGAGSVSSLNYGSRLVTLFTGIGAIAVGTAVTPYFSLMIARGDWLGVRTVLRRYLGVVFLVTLPVAAVLCSFSEPIVRMLLQRGAFSASDTSRVAAIQSLFAIQIPFYVAGILVVRLISCFRMSKILMWGCAVSAILNFALNYVLMRSIGVSGIALSTSLVYCTAFGFLLVLALRQLRARVAMANCASALVKTS